MRPSHSRRSATLLGELWSMSSYTSPSSFILPASGQLSLLSKRTPTFALRRSRLAFAVESDSMRRVPVTSAPWRPTSPRRRLGSRNIASLITAPCRFNAYPASFWNVPPLQFNCPWIFAPISRTSPTAWKPSERSTSYSMAALSRFKAFPSWFWKWPFLQFN